MADQRPDRGIPEDRTRIYEHIADVTSRASAIDMRLVQVGSWLSNPADADSVRSEWSALTSDRKLRKLKSLIPIEWVDGHQLVGATRLAFNYRNSLDHASVDFRFVGDHVVWELRSISKRTAAPQTTSLDLTRLEEWTLRFHQIEYCLKYFIYPGIGFMRQFDKGPELLDLRHALEEGLQFLGDVPEASVARWHAGMDWILGRPAAGPNASSA